MRNLKRVFSLALALVMVLGMMVITSSAATFTDADEITNKEAVEVLNTLGIVNGMGDGTFAPNGTFTREQAAKMITYMKLGPKMAEKLAGTDVFADVASSRWSAKYIGYCANLGIIAGVGGGKFNPEGKLTDIALGKMVLVALGYDAAKYVGDNWATAVTVDMLDAGLVANVTGAEISREDACALILAGMKKGTEVVTFDVKVGAKTVKFDNQNDALLYCAIADSAEFLGKTVEVKNSMLSSEPFNVVYKPVDNDDFGRPAATYTIGKTKLVYAEEATFTYEGYIGSTAGQKQVAADLTEAGVKLTQDTQYQNTYHFDGVYPVIDGVASSTLIGSNYDLTGLSKSKDGVVIEVFVDNKVVTDIVVIETHAAVVDNFVKATKTEKAYIEVEGIKYETEEFAKDDVVLYTKANGKIKSIEKVEGFTGKLTAYNTDNEFTINGEVYTISYGSAEAFNTLKPAIQAQLGKDYVYYLGANGEIIYAHSVKGAKPAVITDYAYIMATDVDYNTSKTSASFGDGETTEVTEVVAMVKVVLSDGTYGIYNLAVEEEKGVFTVEINGKDVELYGETVKTEAAADAALAANVDKIFTYKAAEKVLTLVKDVTPAAATDKITKGSLAVDGALINNDTVVVLGKLNTKTQKIDSWYTTTVAALDATEIAGALVFTTEVKNDKDVKIADAATVIFAVDTAFKASQAKEELDVDAIVYVDGAYSTSIGLDKNGQPVNVYTYTGVKADGTEVDVTGAKGLTAGVYMVNGKGEAVALDAKVATATQDQVVAIVGTTYQLKNAVVTIKADVEPVALSSYVEMEVGADICYITNAKGAIVAVYVLDL